MGLANIHVITEDRASGAQVFDGSLKFVSGSNHHLVRTPSASNRRTFTWSSWHKRTELGDDIHTIFNAAPSSHSSSPAISYLVFEDHNTLRFYNYWSGATKGDLKTNALFRDPNAWYHVVLAVDTTIASPSSDRMKLYVNGEQITSFANESYPTQDLELYINANVEHKIGEESVRDRYEYAGYMSECNFVDGQQLDPSYFGFTEPLTNTWRPKKYTGTYGTNGFYLPMDNQNDFEIDKSGNGNDWTKGNFSGTANDPDVFPDSPSGITYSTVSSAGITTVSQIKPSNYCTLNLLDRGSSYAPTLSDGNLKSASPNNTQNPARGTLAATSGKWYFEGTCTARQYNPGIGVMSASTSLGTGDNFRSFWGTQGAAWYSYTGGTNTIYSNGSNSSYATAFATNDTIMVAYDIDAGKIWFGKNGTWNDSGDPAAGTSHAATFTHTDSITPFIDGSYSSSPGDSWALNFGQKPFKYVPPEGFKVLCLANLPKPTSPAAVRPDKYFNMITWTGDDGASRSLTGVGFAPDFVWIKNRDVARHHSLHDVVRGTNEYLMSSSAGAELTSTELGLASFDSDGFTLGTSTRSGNGQNGNNEDYVAWCWKTGDVPNKTYTVKVVSDSGNKYRFNDYGTSAFTIELQEGGTFTFDQSDSSNSGHPLRFSTTSDGTHGAGTEYTTGVVTNGTPGSAGAYTRITVPIGAPTLYYYCTVHSGMGGQANTPEGGYTDFGGTIPTKISTNVDAGFSIATYTGNYTSGATLAHGLSEAPKVVMVKSRGSLGSWPVYHVGAGSANYLYLERTEATTSGTGPWNQTAPSSSVVTLGNGATNVNDETYVMYAWHDVPGFSKFGSFEGNDSTDGCYVHLGFKPALVIAKQIDTEWTVGGSVATGWGMWDSARMPNNPGGNPLWANLNGTESIRGNNSSANTGGSDGNGLGGFLMCDLLSNGFKARSAGSEFNSAGTHIYMAWAEIPTINLYGTQAPGR